MNRKPVDIIIPVYNAFDDIKLCMASVKKYTDLSLDRVILINDCSPDERVLPYLKSEEAPGVIVLDNMTNQGFSNNVNKGMNYGGDRDVILLNSDTIVTRNWVNKIYECAYSRPEIGTVTPLSNSATLCSVPVICQDNDIPANVTIDEYAEIIERCSMKKYPRITVAVGFCMFIKRQVINEVGLFDAETFERGYGEENDFCNRAEQAGYIHVMCDNTLIYHKGTVSFLTEEKQALIDAHDKILQERYPDQMKRNHLYCATNPDQYIRDNINFYLQLKNDKKNVLYLLQADYGFGVENNIGGTQFHVKDMQTGLTHKYNIYVLGRNGDKMRLTIYIEGKEPIIREFELGLKPGTPMLRDKKQYELYWNILNAFHIDLVHVHHIQGISFDMFYAANALNIPLHMTLHDFTFICGNEKLMKEDKVYCDLCTDRAECKKCLEVSKHISPTVDFLSKWEKECKAVLGMCDRLYTPSESAKEIYVRKYPEIKDKTQVIYHGSELPKRETYKPGAVKVSRHARVSWDFVLEDNHSIIGWAFMDGVPSDEAKIYIEVKDSKGRKTYVATNPVRRNDVAGVFGNPGIEYCGFEARIFKEMFAQGSLRFRIIIATKHGVFTSPKYAKKSVTHFNSAPGRLNVAFLGGMVPAKGSKLATEMIKLNTTDINWYVLGGINDDNLKNLTQDNLYLAGGYGQEDIKMLLDMYKIDVVCILSVWPETFCYTLSESINAGVPVLSNDIGAMGERIAKHNYAWLMKNNSSPQEYVDKLLEIKNNPAEYDRMKKTVEGFKEKTLKEMAAEYEKSYDESFAEVEYKEFDTEYMYRINM